MCSSKHIIYLAHLTIQKNLTVVLNEILKLISELGCDEGSLFVIKT